MSLVTNMRKESGMTLVELLVVLAILAAAAAVAFPQISQHKSNHQLSPMAATLVSQLANVRSDAILRNEARTISYDTKISAFVDQNGVAVAKLTNGFSVRLETARLRSGAGITFFPDGSASGGQIEISNGVETKEISIGWLTGTIELKAGNKK